MKAPSRVVAGTIEEVNDGDSTGPAGRAIGARGRLVARGLESVAG
jgi:hypothetical protein